MFFRSFTVASNTYEGENEDPDGGCALSATYFGGVTLDYAVSVIIFQSVLLFSVVVMEHQINNDSQQAIMRNLVLFNSCKWKRRQQYYYYCYYLFMYFFFVKVQS